MTRGDQTFRYAYDADGNVASRTWPDGTTVASTYDAGDELKTLSAQGCAAGATAAQYTFGYDPSGRLVHTTYPTANHMVTDRSYDRVGRMSDLNSHTDAATVARYQVSRDPVGNPTSITTTRAALAIG